ncbi:hypothetical protein HFP57_03285 [Parasphingopyxis algicola]|uniref:hypothetical protein n=1 Tax=Parasphingopyxis algicola TaxID=2026624 RepID=UPI0015A1EFE6|nr:hypothetical protein [Parasphingopyxis algicola]QLC24147.1 hypothetical protein HFP57_03285 [Parasphingopyxis algicola]
MVEIAAAVFFVFALVAPLAVIILTLQQNWTAIIGALRGTPATSDVRGLRPARLRPVRTATLRPVTVRPARAAA